MSAITNAALFLLSCITLVFSGGVLVKSLTRIAQFLRLSEFVVAFVIMAVATSLPELFVGISAALAHYPSLALGTVIGSNIADITLVGGIMIVLARKITIERAVRTDALLMVGIAALPLILMILGRELSRIDGTILILVFLSYLYYL